VQTYNGPIVLADGAVLACSCVASMDAVADLGIGNIRNDTLLNLWQGARLKQLRESFTTQTLNPTCAGCDMYRDLDLYRSSEGRRRAQANRSRSRGQVVTRNKAKAPFQGG
jgi:radical SAM protein with 4Fe4S-binding SPASM domain